MLIQKLKEPAQNMTQDNPPIPLGEFWQSVEPFTQSFPQTAADRARSQSLFGGKKQEQYCSWIQEHI